MGEPCGCEEALALRAENEGLAVEVKQYRLGNEKLRELARDLLRGYAQAYGLAPLEDHPLLARAKALGVEAGR